MNVLTAELTKLTRSLAWAVVLVLPVVMALVGSATTLLSGEALADGWHTLWLRSVVFHGLFPLAVGIAILAALTWRGEHRGGNWNALMAGPTTSRQIVGAKTLVVAALAAIMQLVMLASVTVLGKVAFGLPGMLPAEYWGYSLLIMWAGLPVAALQSGLSMLMRSFAGPVAVAVVAAGASAVPLVGGGSVAALLSPYALLSRATQLGTRTFADAGGVGVGDLAAIGALGLVLTVVIVAATTTVLERRDVTV